jgi:hypothetical protein
MLQMVVMRMNVLYDSYFCFSIRCSLHWWYIAIRVVVFFFLQLPFEVWSCRYLRRSLLVQNFVILLIKEAFISH